jgi:hypothetical protein
LAREGRLELTTKNAATYVGQNLAAQIEGERPLPQDWTAEDLGAWLLAQPEVAEVFDDDDALLAAYLAAFASSSSPVEDPPSPKKTDPKKRAPPLPNGSPVLTHPYFGKLVYVATDRTFVAVVAAARHGYVQISLELDAPLGDAEGLLDDAATRARDAFARWEAAKAATIEELLETYNVTWRCFEEDGESVERPTLTGDAFAAELQLSSLTIRLPIDAACFDATLWIDPGDLFWGHAIEVSFDGEAIHVSLAG